ncbi:hypothetical protein DFA_10653 [Cavenderia fasciculata]|uniref:Uncharacterized protein n=1 Tax=Cavenderia fasciculata TaxID=261658 RepID=F4QB08_CACFS|nr:uncharacterized protein DFA_10653 [Cavenderia fasciculata]EGG14780.1 hypothetical protein DFA_10653 [Cavenderia fasciculata]|eukprot:XP_004351296.1 hypothetical protein DFA_10653 [Cavenderia fasciculata]
MGWNNNNRIENKSNVILNGWIDGWVVSNYFNPVGGAVSKIFIIVFIINNEIDCRVALNYALRRTLAGPASSTSTYSPKLDPGKAAPSGNSGEGYRRPGTAASGPQSATAPYVPTTDIGKQAPSGQTSDSFRRFNSASGPQSSQAAYTPTNDPGVSSSVSGGGGNDYFSHHNDQN